MKFSCDNCGAQYLIADDKLGRRGVKVRCKKCSHVIIVRPPGYEAGSSSSSAASASAPSATKRSAPSATIDLTLGGEEGSVKPSVQPSVQMDEMDGPRFGGVEASIGGESDFVGRPAERSAFGVTAGSGGAASAAMPATSPAVRSPRPELADGLELQYDDLARGGSEEPGAPLDMYAQPPAAAVPSPSSDSEDLADGMNAPDTGGLGTAGTPRERVYGDRDETRVTKLPVPPPSDPSVNEPPVADTSVDAPSASDPSVAVAAVRDEAAELNDWLSSDPPPPDGFNASTSSEEEHALEEAGRTAPAADAPATNGAVSEASGDDSEAMVAAEIGNAFAVMFADHDNEDTGSDAVPPHFLESSDAEAQNGHQDASSNESVPAPESAPSLAESFEWYVGIDDEQVGPLTFEELRVKWQTGAVGPTSLAWRQGMNDWTAIRLLSELAELHSPARASALPAAPSAPSADEIPVAPSTSAAVSAALDEAPAPSAAIRVEPVAAHAARPESASGIQVGPAVAAAAPAVHVSGTVGSVGPAVADEPDHGWRPSAASALASLAAEELAAPEPPRRAPVTDTKAGPALPATTDALERLLEGEAHPRATAFGAAEKSESRVRPLPRRPDTVSSASLRDHATPRPRRQGLLTLIAAIVGGLVLFGMIVAAALYLFLQPGPSAQKSKLETATMTSPAQPPVEQAPPPTEAAAPAVAPAIDESVKPESIKPPPAAPPAAAPAAVEPRRASAPPRRRPRRRTARTSPRKTEPARRTASPPRVAPVRPPPRDLEEDSLINPPGVDRQPARSAARLPKTLDETDILGVLRQNRAAVRTCLTRHTASGSGVEGTMTVYMVVRPSGRPTRVSVSPEFRDTVAGTCIVDKVRAWRFPKFAGESLPVDFPVTVRGR